VRELIRRRVFQEVAEYNARTPAVFQGPVQPEDTERVVNGYALRTPRAWTPSPRSRRGQQVEQSRATRPPLTAARLLQQEREWANTPEGPVPEVKETGP
jgi:hypothetical protein